MSLKEILANVVSKAQHKDFCHKKLMKLVENAFDITKLEELLEAFMKALYKCYNSGCCADKNPYVSRSLEFLAKVAMMITFKCIQPMEITDAGGTTSQVYDISLDVFFLSVLKKSLKFADAEKNEIRFNTCYFIMTLLQNIGNNVEMDYSVCNIISLSLVELLHDHKANIRIQAIKALVRLQEPTNADCMILKSFWTLITDQNSEVRKAVINNIAPHPQSFSKIRMRLTDSDLGVRQAAYTKFAEVNPKLYLKIIDRNIILTCGLADPNKKVQHIINEKVLPKWLNHFEGDYLLFFRALRLDADENDINNFEKLCSDILNIFLGCNSLTDVLKYLPVDKEKKLIPIQQLRLESVFYWSGVITYLRKVEDGEEHLENILPELTQFSNYIENVIKEKSSVTMDEWENLEFQNILCQLFSISSGFDMSDEVGRKTFYALILQILTTNKFQQKVIDKMMQVALQLSSDMNTLSIDFCQVISEIREPLINELPSEDKLRKQNFEMTQLRVKIHQLEIDEEEALKKKDFQHAHMVQNEIKECQRQLNILKDMYCVSEKVRVAKDDPETLCRCLDILIGLLKITKKISPALQSCRDEFLMPLLNNNTSEVHWRFILCLGHFSLMDKDLAFKHANFLCLPIATYRAVPNYDKFALKTSVACLTDLIRMYGVKVIGVEESSQTDLTGECNPANSRRKLYSEDFNEPEILSKDITLDFIIDIILDMLEDEDEGVRQTASTSICRLIASNFPVNPDLFCRLILKWYSPETEKQDPKLRQQLGSIIQCFANSNKGAKKVVQRSVVQIISSIVNASGSSPLLEIDIENVLRFLTALTNTINDVDDIENTHYDIAKDLIERMLNKPNDACTPYFIKLLSYLDVKIEDEGKRKTLLDSTKLLLPDVLDKGPKKNLLKFHDELNAAVGVNHDRNENQVVNGSPSATNLTNGHIEDEYTSIRPSADGILNNGEIIENFDSPGGDPESKTKGKVTHSELVSEEDSFKTNSNDDIKENQKSSISRKKITHANNRLNLSIISEDLEKMEESFRSGEIPEINNTSNTSNIENEKNKKVHSKTSKKCSKTIDNMEESKTGNIQIISSVIIKENNKKIIPEKNSQSSVSNESTDRNLLNSQSRQLRNRISNEQVINKTDDETKEILIPNRKSEQLKGHTNDDLPSTSKNRSNTDLQNIQSKKKVKHKTLLSPNAQRKSKRHTKDHAIETPSKPTNKNNTVSQKNQQKDLPEKEMIAVISPLSTQRKSNRLSKDPTNNKTSSNSDKLAQIQVKDSRKNELSETPSTQRKSLRLTKNSAADETQSFSNNTSYSDPQQILSQVLKKKRKSKSPISPIPKKKLKLIKKVPSVDATPSTSMNSPFSKKDTLRSIEKRLSRKFTPKVLNQNNHRTRQSLAVRSKSRIFPTNISHQSSPDLNKSRKISKLRNLKNEGEEIFEFKNDTKTKLKNQKTEVECSSKNTRTGHKNHNMSRKNKVPQIQTRSCKSNEARLIEDSSDLQNENISTDKSNSVIDKKIRKKNIEETVKNNHKTKKKFQNTEIEKQKPNNKFTKENNSSLKDSSEAQTGNCKSSILNKNRENEKILESGKRNSRTNTKNDFNNVETKENIYAKHNSHRMKKNEYSNSEKSILNSGSSNNIEKKIGINEEKSKRKIKENATTDSIENGTKVLQNSKNKIREIINIPTNRCSSRNSIRTPNQNQINKSQLHQVIRTSSPLTRSRINDQLNKSSTPSRNRLDCSSFSDETILKTFLQGDEEVLDKSLENASSFLSNTSIESKKENLPASPNSLRRSMRKKRSRKDDSSNESKFHQRKKIIRTK